MPACSGALRLLDFEAMRRWLALLLLFIVPLQLSYAAASVYCEHETGMAAKHFGHHLHQHKGQDGSTKGDGHGDSKGTAKKALHDDCGSCHMSMPQVLMQGFEMAEPLTSGTQVWPAGRHFSSADPGRIERPNWTSSL